MAMAMATEEEAAEAVELLLDCGVGLPSDLHDRIVALGDAAVEPLCELLGDHALDGEDAPGARYAPVHAVELLGDLGAAEAVAPMLAVLARTGWADLLHDRVLLSLPHLGRHALEPTLAALHGADPELRTSLLAVLGDLGVRDERIYAALLAQLAEAPETGAGNLAGYGDPRALPYLSAALDRAVPEPDRPLGSRDVIELSAAIEELGGALTAAQAEKRELAGAPMARYREAMSSALRSRQTPHPPARRQERPGRNDPCRCGSGKKYKRCCLAVDETAAPPDA